MPEGGEVLEWRHAIRYWDERDHHDAQDPGRPVSGKDAGCPPTPKSGLRIMLTRGPSQDEPREYEEESDASTTLASGLQIATDVTTAKFDNGFTVNAEHHERSKKAESGKRVEANDAGR